MIITYPDPFTLLRIILPQNITESVNFAGLMSSATRASKPDFNPVTPQTLWFPLSVKLGWLHLSCTKVSQSPPTNHPRIPVRYGNGVIYQ